VDEMKNWYYFKTGSWWVYQEQTTGDLDTVTVYYDWAGFNTSGTQGFEWYCNSSFDGFNYKYRFNDSYSIHCLTAAECTCHKVSRSKTQPGNFVGEGWIFLFPLIEGNYTASGTGWCTLISLYPEYTVGSLTYFNVAEWDIPDDDSEQNVHMKYWIGENAGIVRYQNINLKTDWVCISSIIVQ